MPVLPVADGWTLTGDEAFHQPGACHSISKVTWQDRVVPFAVELGTGDIDDIHLVVILQPGIGRGGADQTNDDARRQRPISHHQQWILSAAQFLDRKVRHPNRASVTQAGRCYQELRRPPRCWLPAGPVRSALRRGEHAGEHGIAVPKSASEM